MNFYRLLSVCSASLLLQKRSVQLFGVIIILIHFITSRVLHFDALIFGYVLLCFFFDFQQMNHKSQSRRILKSFSSWYTESSAFDSTWLGKWQLLKFDWISIIISLFVVLRVWQIMSLLSTDRKSWSPSYRSKKVHSNSYSVNFWNSPKMGFGWKPAKIGGIEITVW
jgi:hypothetical protein